MFTFFQIIDLSHSFSQIIYIFAVVNQLNSLLILITDTNFKFKKTKMKMQSIMRIAMALVIAFGVETTASAQFGGLKGLAKKAKKAVEKVEKTVKDVNDTKDKVTNQAETTVSETADTSDDGGSNVNITWTDFGADYSIAKKTDWSYDSPTEDVLADVAYWLQRLKKSLEKGNANAVDFEALGRVNNGVPLFSYVDKEYHQTASPRSIQAIDNWSKEKDQVVKAAWKVISANLPEKNDYVGRIKGLLNMAEKASGNDAKGYFFDRAFEVTSLAVKFGKIKQGSGDESTIAAKLQSLYAGLDDGLKGNYPSSFNVSDFDAFDAKRIADGQASAGAEVQKMRKGSLLNMYKYAAANGLYKTMPASKGNASEQLIKNYVAKFYPEWGKIVSVSCDQNWKVETNSLGKPIYRHCGTQILCEDQGYKVIHGISIHQDYSGGKYGNSVPRNDKWFSMVDLVK